MSSIILNTEVSASGSFNQMTNDSIDLCVKLNLAGVKFKFNGIDVLVKQDSTILGVMKKYKDDLHDRIHQCIKERLDS